MHLHYTGEEDFSDRAAASVKIVIAFSQGRAGHLYADTRHAALPPPVSARENGDRYQLGTCFACSPQIGSEYMKGGVCSPQIGIHVTNFLKTPVRAWPSGCLQIIFQLSYLCNERAMMM